MAELEALGLDRVRTQASVQHVDHNLLQADERNMADHLFLRSACQRFAVRHRLSPRQVAMVLAGGQIPLVRGRQADPAGRAQPTQS